MAINFNLDDFIYPYFVIFGKNKKREIKSLPGFFRFSVDQLIKDLAEIRKLGLSKILLFGIPDYKDANGSSAYKTDNIIASAVKAIKDKFPSLIVMTDICLCAYTNHGHCGVINNGKKTINHKATLDALSKMALSLAQAGADWVAPSAMAKKQVLAIRKNLDKNGYKKTKILGYSAKFASNFYGPFRGAADSAPQFGDRKAYQLDYADRRTALREIAEDIKEGADMVMVKPALSYLDIISQAKLKFNFPLAAYNVSGEYAMVKQGAKLGLWNEKNIIKEIITSIKRAGADLIISYHSKDIARWQRQK